MNGKTLFLSSFLLMAGWNSADAQFAFKKLVSVGNAITDVSQLEDGKYYAFKNFGRGKFLKMSYEAGDNQLKNDANLSADDVTDGLAAFKLHIDNTGATPLYSFETARVGYYIPVVAKSNYAYAGTTAAQFQIQTTNTAGETKDGYFTIKNQANDIYFNMNDGEFVGWSGDGNQVWHQIFPVTLSDDENDTQICYKTLVKVSDEAISTTYSVATTGTAFSEPNIEKSYYLSLSASPSDMTITKDNMTFEYGYTKDNLPFTAGRWYSLKIDNGTRIMRAVSEDNAWYVNTEDGMALEGIANTYPNFLNALWCIEESGLGVKLYNKGTGKYLKLNGTGTDKARRASLDATGTVLYVKQNENGLGFYNGSGNGYLNACCFGSSTWANSRLGVWNDARSPTDGGSRFLLEKTEDELLALGKTAFAATEDEAATYSEYDALKTRTCYSLFVSQANDAVTLDALFEVKEKAKMAGVPEAGVYYLIRNVNGGELGRANYDNVDPENDRYKYLSTGHMICAADGSHASSEALKRVKGKTTILPLLWQFVDGGNNRYYLKNANLGICAIFNSMPASSAEAGAKTLFSLKATNTNFGDAAYHATNDGTTMFLMDRGSGDNPYLNAANGATYEGVGGWSGEADAGNYWQLVKVTKIPLTIAANDYTTLGLPFAVKLPQSETVKAYFAKSAEGNVLRLQEITGGIIPANTGVILQNTGDEAVNLNLAITTEEATDDFSSNKLVGVNAKRQGYESGDNYVLAEKNGKTGFYVANFTTIVANKAYLPKSQVVSAQGTMMAFAFGDDVTGITSVSTSASAGRKYYDLQGRRVLYPSKGIFVTEDGQKVLLK